MILRALMLRPTLRRPARALATVGGVAIGVAAFVATALASRAAVASMRGGVEELAGGAALEISRAGGVDEAALASLRELCGEALFVPVVDETALAPRIDDLVRVLGLDLLVEADPRGLSLAPEPSAGGDALETMLHGKGAALSSALAAELGVAPGERFELLARARKVELEVATVFAPERFASAWRRVLVVDLALAQELYGRGRLVDRVEVHPRLALDRDGLAARIRELLPPGHRVEPPSDRRRQAEELLAALEFDLLALSGISILIGTVLVATTLATSVVQRRATIALLRSLGASRAQLARAVLVEAAAIGLAGGALGVAGGWLGARAALASVRATVASLVAESMPGAIELDARWIVFGALAGLAAALGAALLPLREALRTPPLQALRGEAPESFVGRRWRARLVAVAALLLAALACAALPALGGRPVGGLLSALCLLATLLVGAPPLVDLLAAGRHRLVTRRSGAPLALARAGLEAGRARAAWAAGAVGVAVALSVSMSAMIRSFRAAVVEWTEQAMRADLFVRPLPGATGVAAGRLDSEVAEAAFELFGAGVEAFHATDASFRGGAIEVAGGELAVVAREGGVPFLDGRPSRAVFEEALARRGALVNEPFARRFGVDRGERIRLDTAAGPVEREVVGVYRSYSSSGGIVVLDRADFLSLFPDEGPRSLAIFLEQGVEPDAARARLLERLGGRFALEVLPQAETRAEVLAIFERTFAVTVALQLVAAAVAAIAVLTVLFALVSERRRELAVVRALGGSRAQVAGVVVAQAGMLGLGGALGGIAVGLLVGLVLVEVVNVQSFGWSMPFAWPWADLGRMLAAVVPAALLAGLAPALATARMAPKEVLREEG